MGWWEARELCGPTASDLVGTGCQVGMISTFHHILRSPAQLSTSCQGGSAGSNLCHKPAPATPGEGRRGWPLQLPQKEDASILPQDHRGGISERETGVPAGTTPLNRVGWRSPENAVFISFSLFLLSHSRGEAWAM